MPLQHELKLPSRSRKLQELSKTAWNLLRQESDADFYTLGYSGREIHEVLSVLSRAGVRTLLDVRTHAVSMYKPAFSKSNLRHHLSTVEIEYEHLEHFGVPRDVRAKAIATGTRRVIWDWYDVHVVDYYIGNNLHNFFNSAEHPVAFMCSELDPVECHRHRLALGLERLGLKSYDL